MEKSLDYFSYQFADWMLIGNNTSQIINTLKYYRYERAQRSTVEKKMYEQIPIPSDKEIIALEGDVNIPAVLPFAGIDHNIDARVRPNVVFNVNANAVSYVKRIADSYEKLKRGDLYKFMPGIDAFGVWFLPEDIMKGLKKYDWEQHKELINSWLNKREEVLNEGEKRGYIARPFKNIQN